MSDNYRMAYKVSYTTVAINHRSKLITIQNHCYVNKPTALNPLLEKWNRSGKDRYHYYVSVEQSLANSRTNLEHVSELEIIQSINI